MASVFDPLISLSRQPIMEDDIDWIVDQLDNGPDSSAAILGGTFVESILKDLIIANLVESSSGHGALFKRNGPLSSFDSLILIAYSFGLIDKERRQDLDAIRQLRNAFAHAPRKLHFEMPEVAAVCDTLRAARRWVHPKRDLSTPRKKLSACVGLIALEMIMDIAKAAMRKDGIAPSPGK
jgi:DNA-binding MltR family transcriptional regulator